MIFIIIIYIHDVLYYLKFSIKYIYIYIKYIIKYAGPGPFIKAAALLHLKCSSSILVTMH